MWGDRGEGLHMNVQLYIGVDLCVYWCADIVPSHLLLVLFASGLRVWYRSDNPPRIESDVHRIACPRSSLDLFRSCNQRILSAS